MRIIGLLFVCLVLIGSIMVFPVLAGMTGSTTTLGASGNDKNVQWSDSGTMAGSDDMTWDNSTKTLAVYNVTVSSFSGGGTTVLKASNTGAIARDTNSYSRWRGSAAAAPSGAVAGDLYFNSVAVAVYIYNTNWIKIS